MSDPVSNSDIEDVLSSIRRLVSEEPTIRKAPDPEAAALADRLVLTPAFRVEDDQTDVDPEDHLRSAQAQDPEDQHMSDGALAPILLMPNGQVEEVAAEEGPQPSEEEALLAFEPNSEWTSEDLVEEPDPATSEDPDVAAPPQPPHPAEMSLEERIAELEAAIERAPQEWEPDGSEDGTDDQTRPISADLAPADAAETGIPLHAETVDVMPSDEADTDLADEAETADLADEAEAADLADEAETADLADEAETADLADEAEAADLPLTGVAEPVSEVETTAPDDAPMAASAAAPDIEGDVLPEMDIASDLKAATRQAEEGSKPWEGSAEIRRAAVDLKAIAAELREAPTEPHMRGDVPEEGAAGNGQVSGQDDAEALEASVERFEMPEFSEHVVDPTDIEDAEILLDEAPSESGPPEPDPKREAGPEPAPDQDEVAPAYEAQSEVFEQAAAAWEEEAAQSDRIQPDADPALDEHASENLLDHDDTVTMDEAALRELVGELVREELQGMLGERITRNVRRLVRHEIQRALSVRDLHK